MVDQLNAIEAAGLAALAAADTTAALEAWRVAHLGRSAPLMAVLGDLGKLDKSERPAIGQRGNEVKRALEAAYAARAEALRAAEMEAALRAGALDVTLPGRPRAHGRLHPATQTLRQIYSVFADMGFQIYRSREVESDEYNFELLNMPPHHPARAICGTRSTPTRPTSFCARTPRRGRCGPCVSSAPSPSA